MDCFALLNEPRRPWLDPESLKQKFLALSAEVHPDRVHGAGAAAQQAAQERYTDLNAAYHCLREPKDRLRHLLELERGARPAQVERIPSDLMDLSTEVAQLCRQADGLLEEKTRNVSPMMQVQMFERGQVMTGQLSRLQQQIHGRRAALEAELKELDGQWMEGEPAAADQRKAMLQKVEELARLFSYFGRWSSHIQERLVRLSF